MKSVFWDFCEIPAKKVCDGMNSKKKLIAWQQETTPWLVLSNRFLKKLTIFYKKRYFSEHPWPIFTDNQNSCDYLRGDWRTQKAQMKRDTEQTMKLKQLYQVGSECELNSWPDSSVGENVWTEFSSRGFKSHSGQLSIATSKNLSVLNTICISSFCYTHTITYRKLRLKKRGDWRRQTAEMKCATEQTMKLE